MSGTLPNPSGGSNSWDKAAVVASSLTGIATAAAVSAQRRGERREQMRDGMSPLYTHNAPKSASIHFGKAGCSKSEAKIIYEEWLKTESGRKWEREQTEWEPGSIGFETKRKGLPLIGEHVGGLSGHPRVSPGLHKKKDVNDSSKKVDVSLQFEKFWVQSTSPEISTNILAQPDDLEIDHFLSNKVVFQNNFVNSNCSESQIKKNIELPFRSIDGSLKPQLLYEISTDDFLAQNRKSSEETVFVQTYSENHLKYLLNTDSGLFFSSILLSGVILVITIQSYKYLINYFISRFKDPDGILKIVIAYNENQLAYEQAFFLLRTQYNQTDLEAIDLLEPAYNIDLLESTDKPNLQIQDTLESDIQNENKLKSIQPSTYFQKSEARSVDTQNFALAKSNRFRRSTLSKAYLEKVKKKRIQDQNNLLNQFLTLFFALFRNIGSLFLELIYAIGRFFSRFWPWSK